jgi:hypothetical protein
MDFVAFAEKELCKVTTVLAGDSSNEGFFHALSFADVSMMLWHQVSPNLQGAERKKLTQGRLR